MKRHKNFFKKIKNELVEKTYDTEWEETERIEGTGGKGQQRNGEDREEEGAQQIGQAEEEEERVRNEIKEVRPKRVIKRPDKYWGADWVQK